MRFAIEMAGRIRANSLKRKTTEASLLLGLRPTNTCHAHNDLEKIPACHNEITVASTLVRIERSHPLASLKQAEQGGAKGKGIRMAF
jgi:hypothetical protein